MGAFFTVQSLAPQTIGESVRRKVVGLLKEHYQGHSVSIRRCHFDPDVGFIFEDLRIGEGTGSPFGNSQRQMIRIERLTVMGEIDAQKLLDQKNPLKTERVVLDGVQVNAWMGAEEKLSLFELLPLPKFGPTAPQIDLRRVKLRFSDLSNRRRPIDTEFSQISMVSTPRESSETSLEEFKLGLESNMTAQAQDEPRDTSITIRGTSDFANELLVKIDVKNGAMDVRGAVKGAYLSRDLFDRLPPELAEQVDFLRDVDCHFDATLSLLQTPEGKIDYEVKSKVHDGRFVHAAIPQPISQLTGAFVCRPDGITIETSQCGFGDAIVRVDGKVNGYTWPSDVDLNVSARGLMLDDRLASALPANAQVVWGKIQPVGQVDIDVRLSHAYAKWNTNGTLICKGVDIRYGKFPYPVNALVGRVNINDGIASADGLNGRLGDNRLQCAFSVPIQPEITRKKSFVIATDGAVPIDNTLLTSLSPRGAPATGLESFVRSLHPRGSVALATARFITDAEGRKTRKLDLRVVNGHIRYDKFAYPLYNVAGKILVEDDLITLDGFRATNANEGVIRCRGMYKLPVKTPAPGESSFVISDQFANRDPASQLKLNFFATNVPMDDALRKSLPPATRQAWDSIAPSGVLDQLEVSVGRHGLRNPLDLDIMATQRNRDQVTSRTLSLRPPAIPYRLDVTGGTVRFDGSQVLIDSISARHDASTLSADGSCVRDANGRWGLSLNLHNGSRLNPDAELIAALPTEMREAMRRLQLRGPVSVSGRTVFALPDATHDEPDINWDLVLQLEGNRIADVGAVHSIRGEVKVKGVRDALGPRADGEVWIDSMHVYDLQITGIKGPYSVVGDRLRLGNLSATGRAPTDRSALPTSPSISGRIFDGNIDLDGEVVLSSGKFDVEIDVRDAQLPTLLADFGHSDNELTGTLSGRTELQGNLGTTDLLKGNGVASVTGANIYKLPLIVQVLNQIRVNPTEDVAFTDATVEYGVFGDTITFDDLEIWGDLVQLHGGGTLDHRRELDLTFNTRVSPQNTFSQIIRPLRSKRYTLGTIDVRGPLNDLEIERRALDGVGETLERLFPGRSSDDESEATETTEKSANRFGKWFR